MITKTLKMYEDFIGEKHKNNYSYIKDRMKGLSDLVNSILEKEYESSARFDYLLDRDELEITLIMDTEHEVVKSEFVRSKVLTILFDIETLLIGTYIGYEEDFRVGSIEEGMDLIEKKIYDVLCISESNKK